MIRSGKLAALLVLPAVLLAGRAPGAEKARPPDKITKQQLGQLEGQAARFSTAAVVEVILALKAEDEKAAPALPQNNRFGIRFGGARQFAGKAQRARCRVVEMLRGPQGVKEITVVLRHFDYYGPRRRLQTKDPKKGAPAEKDILTEASFGKGQKYLVLLVVDENLKPEEGAKGPVYSTVRMPLYGPPAEAVKVVREMARKVREYQKPPKASAKQLADAGKHLEAFKSREFTVRRNAHAALVKLGARVRDLVAATGKKTKDLEVRLRCKKILEDIKPIPGGHADDWAGDYVIKKVEESKEELSEDEKAVLKKIIEKVEMGGGIK